MRKKPQSPDRHGEERNTPLLYHVTRISTASGKGYEYTILSSAGTEYLLLLSPEQHRGHGVKEGAELDGTKFEELRTANQQFNAYTKGLDILNFDENNRHQIVYKLMKKGFSRKVSEETAQKLADNGYIDEKKQIRTLIHGYAHRRYYGQKRIVAELLGKNYDMADIESVTAEEFPNIDFAETCAYIISRKFLPLPRDREGLNRMLSSLVRYGYAITEIKEAIRRVSAKSENGTETV